MTQMLVELDARTATVLQQRAQVSGLSVEAMASQLLQKAIAQNKQDAQVQDATVTANWLSSIRAKVQSVEGLSFSVAPREHITNPEGLFD